MASDETLEILGDETLMAELRRSIREAEAGESVPWEAVRAELGLGDAENPD